MQLGPILVALRRHKAGTTLIALQIALTLAIVCNALFIIQQRLVRVDRPSGVQEADLFVIQTDWPEKLSAQDAAARRRPVPPTASRCAVRAGTTSSGSAPTRSG